eukprot:TRINITY_DN6193_c0_g1_i1.p1 TRINITY_DN6193_c0_g1~~TRINITY_DN6193_c0_g1_i1.p1  ORF type:complete len:349 (+),score=-45.18 TRINITY_DN6193_c0_g1_i1:366-1412(+)
MLPFNEKYDVFLYAKLPTDPFPTATSPRFWVEYNLGRWNLSATSHEDIDGNVYLFTFPQAPDFEDLSVTSLVYTKAMIVLNHTTRGFSLSNITTTLDIGHPFAFTIQPAASKSAAEPCRTGIQGCPCIPGGTCRSDGLYCRRAYLETTACVDAGFFGFRSHVDVNRRRIPTMPVGCRAYPTCETCEAANTGCVWSSLEQACNSALSLNGGSFGCAPLHTGGGSGTRAQESTTVSAVEKEQTKQPQQQTTTTAERNDATATTQLEPNQVSEDDGLSAAIIFAAVGATLCCVVVAVLVGIAFVIRQSRSKSNNNVIRMDGDGYTAPGQPAILYGHDDSYSAPPAPEPDRY